MNDWIAIWLFSTPILCAALGDVLVQRSGLLNIGLEGEMLLGAFVSFAVSSATGNPCLGLLCGGAAGLVLAYFVGVLAIDLLADQVVVGMAVIFLSLGVTAYLYQSQFGMTGSSAGSPVLPKWNGIDAVMASSLVLVPAFGFLLYKTKWGLALRACGEYPAAAESAHLSVRKIRYLALAIGGLMAGIAGAELSIGIAGSFSENMTQGRGFVAIAMVTFGRWKPQWVLASCLLIGWLESIQFLAQSKGWDIPFRLLLAMPYVTALLVLVIVGRGAAGPASLGVPFRKSK
jgi:ABC-type uncharacterized transport system permease subunit